MKGTVESVASAIKQGAGFYRLYWKKIIVPFLIIFLFSLFSSATVVETLGLSVLLFLLVSTLLGVTVYRPIEEMADGEEISPCMPS